MNKVVKILRVKKCKITRDFNPKKNFVDGWSMLVIQ